MKKLLLYSIFTLISTYASLGHTLSFDHPGGGDDVLVAWQGAATTIGSAFGTNVPNGTQVFTWNVTNQSYDSNGYYTVLGGWTNPNETLNPAEAMLVRCGTATTFTISGSDLQMTGDVFSITFTADKYYLIGFAYPRAGYIEKNPSPYSPSANLNFPGDTDSDPYAAFSDEYLRWDVGLQAWQFTRRLNEVSNEQSPSGGYNDANRYGARWFAPGSTSQIQGNGVADNWISIGEGFFVKFPTTRVWNMYKYEGY